MEAISVILQDLFSHTAEVLVVFGIALISACMTQLKNWWDSRAARRFERGINENIKIRELLSECRALCDADRVELFQVHNGDYYVAGGSIMKVSLTHYVLKTGISAPINPPTIPTTHMLTTLKCLDTMHTCKLRYGDQAVDDSFQVALFAATGIESVRMIAVKNTRGNWIGILCATWMDEETDCAEALKDYSRQVGEFMSKPA